MNFETREQIAPLPVKQHSSVTATALLLSQIFSKTNMVVRDQDVQIYKLECRKHMKNGFACVHTQFSGSFHFNFCKNTSILIITSDKQMRNDQFLVERKTRGS